MHHGCPFAQVGAQPNTGCVSDTHARRDDVVDHARELVHAVHRERPSCHACLQLSGWQLVDGERTFAGPGNGRQRCEDTLQVQAVRNYQAPAQEVQLQIGFAGRADRIVALEHCGDREHAGTLECSRGVGELRRAERVQPVHESAKARIVDFNRGRTFDWAEHFADARCQRFTRRVQRVREVHVEDRAVCSAMGEAEAEGKHLETPGVGAADSSLRW